MRLYVADAGPQHVPLCFVQPTVPQGLSVFLGRPLLARNTNPSSWPRAVAVVGSTLSSPSVSLGESRMSARGFLLPFASSAAGHRHPVTSPARLLKITHNNNITTAAATATHTSPPNIHNAHTQPRSSTPRLRRCLATASFAASGCACKNILKIGFGRAFHSATCRATHSHYCSVHFTLSPCSPP